MGLVFGCAYPGSNPARLVRCADCVHRSQIIERNELGDGYCPKSYKVLVGFYNNYHALTQMRKCWHFLTKKPRLNSAETPSRVEELRQSVIAKLNRKIQDLQIKGDHYHAQKLVKLKQVFLDRNFEVDENGTIKYI